MFPFAVQETLFGAQAHCARAGSDNPRDDSARVEAAMSQGFRQFEATPASTASSHGQILMASPIGVSPVVTCPTNALPLASGSEPLQTSAERIPCGQLEPKLKSELEVLVFQPSSAAWMKVLSLSVSSEVMASVDYGTLTKRFYLE